MAATQLTFLAKRLRRVGTLLAAIFLGSNALLLAVLQPPHITPGATDAVFVFAGDGDGHRLSAAIDLMVHELSHQESLPHMVISHGSQRGRTAEVLAEICAELGDQAKTQLPLLEVTCIVPYPTTTRGEAAAFARLAETNGWTSVIGVSSSYHAARVRTWLNFCMSDTEIQVVGAPTQLTRQLITHELGGLLHAYAQPWCPPRLDGTASNFA